MNSLTLEPAAGLNVSQSTVAAEPAPTTRRRKPRVWPIFTALVLSLVAGVGVLMAAQFAIAVGLGFTMGVQGADMATFNARYAELLSHPLLAVVMTYIPFQSSMLAIVLLAARLSPTPTRERVGLVPQTGRTYGGFKLSTLACFTLAGGFASNLVMFIMMGAPTAADPISTAITNGSWWTISALSVLISLVPAVVEEIFFRGYMQRRFQQRWSPAFSIGLTSVIFALMHADSVAHIIAVLPLSVVTGLLAYRSNSVKPGMVVHGLHNAAVVGFGTAMTVLPQYVSQEVLGLGVLAMIPTLGLIGLPAVIGLLRKTKQPVVATYVVPEEPVETLSVLKRELALSESVTESRVTTQAV